MRRLAFISLVLLTIVMVICAGCGGLTEKPIKEVPWTGEGPPPPPKPGTRWVIPEEDTSPPTSQAPVPTITPSQPAPKMQLTNENWHLVLTEAKGAQKAYIGSPVILMGKVGQVIARTGTETQIAIDTNFEEITFGQRTVVALPKDIDIKEGNWVKVEGKLDSYWNTQNMFSAELRVPIVVADNIFIISRSQAIPPIVTINVGKTITQHGLSITLEKVEIAVSETRIYVKASNDSTSKASLYSYDSVIVQGQNQVKVKQLFGETDIKEPDTTLVSGTVTSGVIMFEPLDPNVRQAKLIWSSPRAEDWQLQFSDWIWEFSW